MNDSFARHGWTAVDVLVLLLLVFFALGLAVPFVVEQHRKSQRAQCSYNLQQIGKAVAMFNEERGFLPPARIADDYATWVVLMAPYLEKRRNDDKEHPLLDWETGRRYADQPTAARQAVLRQMFCPARQRGGPLSVAGDGVPHVPGAVGDYACVSGDGREECPWTGDRANGPMILGQVLKEEKGLITSWRGRTKLDQTSLKRGLSCTLLLGEKHVPFGDWGQADEGDGCVYNGGRPAGSARVAGPGHGLAATPSAPFAGNFGSYHADVCLFLQADMAIHPVATKISPAVLGRLMIRDDD